MSSKWWHFDSICDTLMAVSFELLGIFGRLFLHFVCLRSSFQTPLIMFQYLSCFKRYSHVFKMKKNGNDKKVQPSPFLTQRLGGAKRIYYFELPQDWALGCIPSYWISLTFCHLNNCEIYRILNFVQYKIPNVILFLKKIDKSYFIQSISLWGFWFTLFGNDCHTCLITKTFRTTYNIHMKFKN